jgi:hypothetical protein
MYLFLTNQLPTIRGDASREYIFFICPQLK